VLVAFVCAIGPLVFFHELGHYLVARLFGIPAEAFSIGFGRALAGWTDRRGTHWKVGWVPLGGYVKFVGDMSPVSEPGDLDSVPEHLRDRIFQVRPVWQRFVVVLAGPAANFLLAILIFAAIFMTVGWSGTNVVGGVVHDGAAAAAGLRSGDQILSVDGKGTADFSDLQTALAPKPNQIVLLRLARDGQIETLPVRLKSENYADAAGHRSNRGVLGVRPKTLPVTRAIVEGSRTTWEISRVMVDGIVGMIRGQVSTKQLGGPITIARVAGQGAELGVLPFVQLLALLSINLGFINLLPVPMLDGGHLFFYVVEAVRRRPLSARALDLAFRGGLAVILTLVIFTTINDLGSLGLWDRLQRLIG
jgi:regulator of sigma E protease